MDAQERVEAAARRAQDQLAELIWRVREESRQGRTQGFAIPTLDDDPPAGDPTTIWRFEDGRLRVRRADGGVDEFVPTVDYRPQLPSFSTAPSLESGWRFWMDPDNGVLRCRLADDSIMSFIPDTGAGSGGEGGTGSSGGGSSKTPKPADPRPHRHTATFPATWAKTFCTKHGKEGGSQLHYGFYPGSHGTRRIMLGLNDSAIRSELNGATIRGVAIRMRNTHAYANSGIEVHFGGHDKSGEPAGYSSVRERVFHNHWPKSGFGKDWRGAPDWFGRKLRDGAISGITINQPSNSIGFYGQMDPSSFRIRITYTHAH